jgi:hypothetical protein
LAATGGYLVSGRKVDEDGRYSRVGDAINRTVAGIVGAFGPFSILEKFLPGLEGEYYRPYCAYELFALRDWMKKPGS